MNIEEAKIKKAETEYRLTAFITSEVRRFMDETGLFVERVEIHTITTRTLDSNEVNVIITEVVLNVHI